MSVRLAFLISAAYVVARLACRRLLSGTWVLDGELVAQLLVVPLVQILVLAVVERIRGKPL
jgi:hypothetical protein